VSPLEACSALVDPGAARALDGTLDQDYLAGALARLTPDQAQVIRLRILHDRSLAATARQLGKHEDAVKQLQVRALRRMRRTLSGA
ncbi:MAG: RNA polymerase subunit sigma-24, partial [Chloroflexota bacterium]|nr:RNA polymerase subunit sigma-24 [Chloroflexota bacterium]